jgi:hypothetical protein
LSTAVSVSNAEQRALYTGPTELRMNIPRAFIYQLPLSIALLGLTTVVMVRATAPAAEPNIVTSALRAADAIKELASE